MSTKKVMRLLDVGTGEMECKVCGARHFGYMKPGGGYRRGAWQCVNGCKLAPGTQAKVLITTRDPAKARALASFIATAIPGCDIRKPPKGQRKLNLADFGAEFNNATPINRGGLKAKG